jgi:hypothetical protein
MTLVQESLRIVVPSRRRVRNMPRLLALLPEATVCVAEAERKDYAVVVPPKQLVCHPNVDGICRIRNWMSRHFQEECLVEIDDDFRGMRNLTGKQRLVEDHEKIAAVIHNAQAVSFDLGIPVFCWSRTQNTAMSQPALLPVRMVQPISCAFGLRGPARQREFDPDMPGRADFDFTLRTLLEDRVVYADMRWYFDHGRIFSGRGGAVGLISEETFKRSTAILHERWGQYVGRKSPGFIKGRRTTSLASIKVTRMSPLGKVVMP